MLDFDQCEDELFQRPPPLVDSCQPSQLPAMSAFNTTIFGETLRLVTGNRFPRYPDERELPAKYAGGAKAEQQQQQPSRRSSTDTEQTRVGQQGPGEQEKGEDPNIVGWYGPDDPENPRFDLPNTVASCRLTMLIIVVSSPGIGRLPTSHL